jgi:hypothetical protein
MSKPGPKTKLEEKEFLSELKRAVFDFTTLKDIAEACEVPMTTMYTWHSDNYLGLADKIEGWRRDKKLAKADKNIDDILDLPVNDKDFTKTVADMSKFVKETLDKPYYSKRSEHSGPDGKELPSPIMMIERNVQGDDSDNQD